MREDWSKVEPLVAGSWRHGCIGAIRGERRATRARIERVPKFRAECRNNCDQPVLGSNGPLLAQRPACVCVALLSSRTDEAWSPILLNPVPAHPALPLSLSLSPYALGFVSSYPSQRWHSPSKRRLSRNMPPSQTHVRHVAVAITVILHAISGILLVSRVLPSPPSSLNVFRLVLEYPFS